MSSTTNPLLTTIPKQVTIYLAIPILIAGLIGGVLNIMILLSLKTFRQNSCAFFLTIMSFVNIGQLLTSLLSRIMITGFNLNWTETSLFYCKFRSYCLQVCALISYSCMCLATIDQFLATSLRPRWQQLLNIKRAHILSVIVFTIWLIHGIPSLVWHSPMFSARTGGVNCALGNANYQLYYSYVHTLILAGILPITITVLFGCMAYWNVRQIPYRTVPLVRRELDKQLTSMVLVQVVHNVIVVVPYISILIIIYAANLSSQTPGYAEMAFSNFVCGLIYYLYFANPFYIYVCVSKRFRQQLIYVLFGSYLRRGQQPVAIGIAQVYPEIPKDSTHNCL